ncbi:cyclic nucleotide-binding protein [Candidatus Magnetominusculus xianensis]|uniref:Cyclic nucleotide-binding protein n=2 Tax=Candidatus Magnetominusculus xianensis TaxID=1748249 RepID=A0ABR5SC66_9BACT|nr:cyclic nucleotide-binding protein [Candidatus Magnetominusculus xianensis]
MCSPAKLLAELYIVIVESIKSFIKNNNMISSAALAYYGIFASIPMLILAALFLVNYFTSSMGAVAGLKKITSIVLPDQQDVILKEAFTLSSLNGSWGIVGIVACVWSITPLMSTLRIIFANIFREENRRPFFVELAIDVVVVFLFLLILISLVIGEIVYSHVTSVIVNYIPFVYQLIVLSTNLLISIAALTAFFYVLIPVRTSFWNILAGVMLTSVLWAVVKPSFAYFIVINPHFGFAFGSLKTILLIILWVYMSFFILLIGVEFTAHMHRRGIVSLKYLIEIHGGKIHNVLLYKYASVYNASDVVFQQGDAGSEMYYILGGAVQITEGDTVIYELNEGQIFGEAGMLLNSSRTETATVITDNTFLLPINEAAFGVLSQYDPQLVVLLFKEMAKKLGLQHYHK